MKSLEVKHFPGPQNSKLRKLLKAGSLGTEIAWNGGGKALLVGYLRERYSVPASVPDDRVQESIINTRIISE